MRASWPSARRLVLPAAGALLLGGCGGDGDGGGSTKHFDTSSTRVCLQTQQLRTRSGLNTRFPGDEGNVLFNSEGQSVNLVFDSNAKRAASDAKDVKDFLKSGAGDPDTVKTRGNVVYYALGVAGYPDDSQAKVEKCLK